MIVNWFNNNEGFAISLLTLLYLLATVLIYSANSKNNKLQKKIQKQNVDIQLFNKRLILYNQIKDKIDKPFVSLKGIFNGNTNKNKILFNEEILFKVKYLFFENIYNQLFVINNNVSDILKFLKTVEIYYKKISERNSDFELRVYKFRDYLEIYYKEGQFSDKQNEEFKELCNKNISDITVNENTISVNFYDYFINYNILIDELSKESNILFNKIYSVMDTDCFKEIDLKKLK